MASLVQPTIAAGSLSSTERPVLRASPMTLRPWTESDAPAVSAAYADPEIRRWHARSMSCEEASTWIAEAHEAWTTETGVSWAVDVDGVLAARMTLRIRKTDGIATAAYWVRPAFRGRGIAARALDLATHWAFSVGIHRVELEHSTRNPVSCRVATRAGFAEEGTRRESDLHTDGWHDMHTHAKLAVGFRDGIWTR